MQLFAATHTPVAQDHYAVVVVEYNDGRFGTPSAPFGPATPTDEVPAPPEWANAYTGEEYVAEDGEVFLEWSQCTAIDLSSTRMYASKTNINDVIGLQVHSELSPQVGNASTIMLESDSVFWLGLTCYDKSGQEDLANATIIGPIVPNGVSTMASLLQSYQGFGQKMFQMMTAVESK